MARKARQEQIRKKLKNGVCLIFSCGSSHSVLNGFLTRGPDKKRDDLVGIALLEALAGQFIYFGETDVHPRHFQTGRIGGQERGYGEG